MAHKLLQLHLQEYKGKGECRVSGAQFIVIELHSV